jgi:hypothetical protein
LFIRGIATGQVGTGAGMMDPADQGVVFDTASSMDSNGNWIDGESGGVSAGFPGIGDYNIERHYVITHIGASLGKADGYKGQAQVTIPMETVYV